MLLYIHTTCSTCKDAIRFLEKQNVVFTIRDIVKQPPSKAELHAMLTHQNGNVKKLLNTSGMLYREMNLSERLKQMELDEIITLLSSHGMLIKRPFLLGDKFGVIGFKEPQWHEKLMKI